MAKKIGSAYTEDWLPVESIQNGMIVCSDKNKVTGVKIAPRNIFILDAQAQDNVLISLKNFYNITVTLVTFKYLNNINIIISILWEENRGYVFGYDSYDSYVFGLIIMQQF